MKRETYTQAKKTEWPQKILANLEYLGGKNIQFIPFDAIFTDRAHQKITSVPREWRAVYNDTTANSWTADWLNGKPWPYKS